MSFLSTLGFITISISSFRWTTAALAVTQIGNVVIDNGEMVEGDDMIENSLIIMFNDECDSGKTSQERVDELITTFPCISPLDIGEDLNGFITFDSDPHSYFMADISDSACLNDWTDLTGLCIGGIANDFIPESDSGTRGECINVNVFANTFEYSFALDQFDTYDNRFEAYKGNDKSVNVYIVDLDGIIVEHDEFRKIENLHLPFPNGDTYDVDDPVFGWHGTLCASCAAGIRYGAAVSNQVIYNVYTPSFAHLIVGLSRISLHLQNTRKRGVINMSFGFLRLPLFLRLLTDILLNEIISSGGIPVASAGNAGINVCDTNRIPTTLSSTITVGAHNSDYDVASFSNYGECVDIYGPGVWIRGAIGTLNDQGTGFINNNEYGFASGTSFSAPYIAGIIANYLVECEFTGFDDPCTFDNIKERLSDFSVQVHPVDNIPRCQYGDVCEAAQYFCQRPFYPREVEECSYRPCAEYESGNCRVYNDGSGCSQCEDDSFKISNNYPCKKCRDIMGPACLFCQDGQGCGQCIDVNKWYLVNDRYSGLRYCAPQPCLNPNNNCRVCNNGFCSQCEDGFRLNDDGKSCYRNW